MEFLRGTEEGEEIINSIVAKFFPDLLLSHAEVDMFATLMLLNNGFNVWEDVLKFFDKSIKDSPTETTSDFKNRKRAIE